MSSHGIDLTQTRVIAVDEIVSSADDAHVTWTLPASSEVALLQHSSGTTGLKKGVALSYAAIASQVRSYQVALVLREDDLIASWLPLYHDMGLIACLIVPLSAGVPTIHIDPFEWTARPGILFERITQFHATLCWLPNFAFEHLTTVAQRDTMRYELSSVRAFINCSEVCKPETFDRFVAAFSSSGVTHEAMQCCYAMAETVFAVTQTRAGIPPRRIWIDPTDLGAGQQIRLAVPGPGSRELVEVGSAIPGAMLRAHDASGSPLPDGVVGELGVSADFLFTGYYQQPELTRERLRDGVYFTRDLGFTYSGSVFVLGRLDDVIIVNGRNLYAHEVEALLQGVTGIKKGRTVAVPWNDERNGTQALAIIAERDGTLQRADSAIRAEVLSTVFSVTQATARLIHLVPEGWLVKTTSGKISRDLNLKKLQKELSDCLSKA
jgi:acyl-CoA synthetase (AMP-forming)/AMP-acid ligase II